MYFLCSVGVIYPYMKYVVSSEEVAEKLILFPYPLKVGKNKYLPSEGLN
jgi:hypothetical protein